MPKKIESEKNRLKRVGMGKYSGKSSGTKALLLLLVSLFLIFSASCSSDRQDERSAGIENLGQNPRIIATSMSITEIMEKMDVDLVGVPATKLSKMPKRYKDVTVVGMPMNPDLEIIKSLKPDLILSPASLIADLAPKYENLNLEYGFLNMNSVEGMYKSIDDLGRILHREKKAKELRDEYEAFLKEYANKNEGKKHPKVLMLMGFPGSYVVATDKSYMGSLAKMAGAENVYTSETRQFMNVSVEDMLKKEPDIILRGSHAIPDEVKEMFKKEFKTNDTWKNFKAVKEDRVYDLDYNLFGMSAKFNYPEALAQLEEIFYEKNAENN